MQTSTIPTSQWLKKLQEEYSSIIRQSVFFKTLAEASSPADFNWIRQLYYLSCDFTAAVALPLRRLSRPALSVMLLASMQPKK